jgi:hypothetical protein
MALAQSVPIKQCFPAAHVAHTRPPQSMSVSSPLTLSSLSQEVAAGALPALPITGDVPAVPVIGAAPAVPTPCALPAAAGEPLELPTPALPARPPLLGASSPCCR